MENIAAKKITYNHLSSYKTRGKLGASNRNVRAQRVNENRHLSRIDEVSKRRRIPLSPMADENVADDINNATEFKNDDPKQNSAQQELSRREKLLKWREERMQKKKAEPQKKSFVVRHIKHDNEVSLFSTAIKKATKGAVPLIKPAQFAATKPMKPVTRASARIAKQVSANLAGDVKSHPVKTLESKSKAAANEKVKARAEVKPEKTGRVTRQSLRTKAPSTVKFSREAPEPKNQARTRAQAKEIKDQLPKEACPSKSEENEKKKEQTSSPEENTSNCERTNFPAIDAIKNTVTFGRGSTEGVERIQSSAEAPSFAPAGFQFTAPAGVNTFTYFSKTFKFQPLSPNSAAEFMFPSSASSFLSPKRPTKKPDESPILEDPVAAFNKSLTSTNTEQQCNENACAESSTTLCDVVMETCSEAEKQQITDKVEDNEKTSEMEHSHQQPCETVSEAVTAMESDVIQSQDVDDEQHDAAHFRNLVKKETNRLNEISSKWEKISAEEENLNEEVTGQIRTTIGQAQLLIDQRFNQFSGLIDLSEDKTAEKRATASDLQGFWEMIYFQVEDVNAKFVALERLKENNWQEDEKKARKVIRKTKVKKPSAANDTKTSSKVTSSRNRIQEMRMAMKAKMAADKEKVKAEKRHQEEAAFVTILTPVKKSKKNDGSDEVVLTPVRRSTRKTPLKQSVLNSTPVVVTTPKIISDDSPGLRLTPDNACLPNGMDIIGNVMETKDTSEVAASGENCDGDACSQTCEQVNRVETSEKDPCGTGMVVERGEEKMECDIGNHEPVVLKSACKSANRKLRKCSVSFQSPARLVDQQKTPECMDHEVDSLLVNSTAVCSSMETEAPRRKKGTPQRFMARKCRGRISTPFYQNGPRSRVPGVVDESDAAEDEASGSSDDPDIKAEEGCPGPELRRSLRRTPSKYRDSTPLEAETDQGLKIPADVSVKLFQVSEETKANETPKNNPEQDTFSKYLCQSSSDDEECAKELMEPMGENVFEEKEPPKVDCAENGEATLTPPEQPQNLNKPFEADSASKTGRTPIHLLKYLSDMDTPSPNSREITPMPKTTIFVSPLSGDKTPTLADDLDMMSPENVVRQFPAQNEGSPLLSLGGMAGKVRQASVTPKVQLAAFHLDSPATGENRRDSVFFALPSAINAVQAQENLMCFSPIVEMNDEDEE